MAVSARIRQTGAFTIVELLTVVAIIMLLVAITVPSLSYARARARDTKCATNLHSVGQAIHCFVNAHDDYAAPCIRERDYYWDRGKQIGWDIETGRWANIPGGPGTIWQCPVGQTAYVGNARALGLDNREALENGLLDRVGPDRWYEPALLALAYDLQPNLLELKIYAHARDPYAGDLSDEMVRGWPREGPEPVQALGLRRFGPHGKAYGVLFADGHAAVGRYPRECDGVLWSGRRWWR